MSDRHDDPLEVELAEAPDLITVRPGWLRVALDYGCGRAYRDLRLLKRWPDARRELAEADALARLAADFAGLRHPARAARYAVTKLCASPFVVRRGDGVLRFRGEQRVFADWTGGRLVGGPRRSVAVSVAEAVRLPVKRLLYGISASVRNDRADRPSPASRRSRRALAGASAQTQRRAERQLGIAVVANYCLVPAGSPAPPRRTIRVPGRGLAFQISNSTNLPMVSPLDPAGAGGSVPPAVSLPQPGRVFFVDDADFAAHAQTVGRPPLAYVYEGPCVVDGQTVELWRLAE